MLQYYHRPLVLALLGLLGLVITGISRWSCSRTPLEPTINNGSNGLNSRDEHTSVPGLWFRFLGRLRHIWRFILTAKGVYHPQGARLRLRQLLFWRQNKTVTATVSLANPGQPNRTELAKIQKLIDKGHYVEAKDMLESIANRAGDSKAFWQLSGLLHLRLAEPDKAIECYQTAEQLEKAG